jgi:inhibitor of cysteine peptidase
MSRIKPGVTVLIIYLTLAMIPMALCAKINPVSQQTVITENDTGKTIYLKTGDIFYLRLKENPSTGYSWQLTLSRGLSLLMDKYYSPDYSKKDGRFIVGVAGFHSWEIKTVARGNQQIRGIYKRSWDEDTGNEQTFKINVKIF